MAEGPVASFPEYTGENSGPTGRRCGLCVFVSHLLFAQITDAKVYKMETYPVDIEAGQLVHWLRVESEAVPSTFRIAARRIRELKEIAGSEGHLGDDEREDLTEVETIATLEIAPAHANEGWLLSVVVEDELGPRLSNGGGQDEPTEQVMDLGTFDKEFIRPGRGIVTVVAETRDSVAKEHVTRLVEAIETNRHPARKSKKQSLRCPAAASRHQSDRRERTLVVAGPVASRLPLQ